MGKYYLKRGVIYSVLLHLAVLVISYFGLPSFFEELPPENIVTVELLPVTSVTNIKPATVAQKPAPKPEPKKPEPKKPEPKKPEPPKPEPKKPEVKEETPPPPPPKPKEDDQVDKVEEKKPEPKPEPKKEEPKKPEPKKPEPKKPEPKKPEPPKKKEPTEDDIFKSLEKDLSEKDKQAETKEEKDPIDDLEKTLSNKAPDKYNADMPLSISEEDAVRQQFFQCWTPPIGARDLENMSATVTVQLEKTGRIISTKLHENARYQNDPFYKAFTDSVLRALANCNPLKHTPPAEKYGNWQEMEITFTPKDMY